uniref:Uncharacterized protein n=1 Tax=Arundo donax TaxID=35708 RepID=A0A0A9B6T3_ARUDO
MSITKFGWRHITWMETHTIGTII